MEVSKDFKTVQILLNEKETLGLFAEIASLILRAKGIDRKTFPDQYPCVNELSNKLGPIH